jgi:hypothetical protein
LFRSLRIQNPITGSAKTQNMGKFCILRHKMSKDFKHLNAAVPETPELAQQHRQELSAGFGNLTNKSSTPCHLPNPFLLGNKQ